MVGVVALDQPAVGAASFQFTRHTPEEVNNGAASLSPSATPERGAVVDVSAPKLPHPPIRYLPCVLLWPLWAGRIHRLVEPSGFDDH